MATVTLMSVNDVIYELGIRSLSAFLKSRGHSVRLVFINEDVSELTDANLAPLAELAAGSELIGVSLLTHSHGKAVRLTEFLHARCPSIPVAWGGIHASGFPEESLKYADFVCLGEGEETLAELAECLEQERSFNDIRNLCYRDANGTVRLNPVRQPIKDLDALPFQDYSLDSEYVLEQGAVVRMDEEQLRKRLLYYAFRGMGYVYVTMGSRGCPFNCTFCCNNVWHNLYGSKGVRVRTRSVDSVIRELEEVLERFPFFRMVMLEDDSFLVRDVDDIQRFARLYRDRVGVTFGIEMNPNEVSYEKLAALKEAGLGMVHVGIQSGDEHIRKSYYNRYGSDERIFETNRVLSQLRILHKYDIIVDTPFPGDAEASVAMLRRFRGLFSVNLYSLRVYPGLAIERIMRDAGFSEWLAANDTSVSYESIASSEPYAMVLKRYVPFPPTRVSVLVAKFFSAFPTQIHWVYERLGIKHILRVFWRLGGRYLYVIYRRIRIELLRLEWPWGKQRGGRTAP